MDPIAEIRDRIRTYPGAEFAEGPDWIRYVPSSGDGFTVELLIQDGEYVVSYEAWHEHFDEAISAIRCFAFGLSKTCRLKIISRGKQPHKWIVESLQDGEWVVDSTMGLMIYPFWRKPRVEYRQNPLM